MKRACRLFLLAWLALCALGLDAQQPAPGKERWISVRGGALRLALAPDGTAFVLDADGRVWRRRPGATSPWTPLAGDFTRIDAGPGGIAWALDRSGNIYQYTGRSWIQVPGTALDIGVGPEGTVWILQGGGLVARHEPAVPAFRLLALAPPQARRIDVDETGLPWVLLEDGRILRHDGVDWRAVLAPLRARDLAIGPEGTVMVTSAEGRLYWLDRAGAAWHPVDTPPAATAALSVGPRGKPWIVAEDGSILASEIFAESTAQAAKPPPVFSRLLPWRRVRGAGKELSIGPRGEVYALGPAGEVWQWKGRETWSRLPGRLERVAAAATGLPWGIDERGRILQFRGASWAELPGTAREIAIGASGAVWIVSPDGTPARWNPKAMTWEPVPGVSAARIAVDPEGRPWILAASGAALRFDGTRWEPLPGLEARDIAIGPEGTVYAAGNDGRPYRYNPVQREWVAANGEAVRIAVGPRGFPWALTAQAEIYATSLFEDELEQKAAQVRAAPPAAVTPPPPVGSAVQPTRPSPAFFFQKVPGSARDIAIGNDGSVFVIGFDGNLLRWSNARSSFQPFPGTAQRVAVQRDGRPWVVTTAGEVFRYDGASWRVVREIVALDIAIGGATENRDDVVVTDPAAALHRYDPASDRFVRMFSPTGKAAPEGTRVALDGRGRPWTITAANQVFRCDVDPCEFVAQQARDIAIGPEGSIYVVDLDRNLRRFERKTGRFERLEPVVSAVDAVAAGPRGVPWIVKANSEVFAAGFFERDEKRDQDVAQKTVLATTTPAATPVFTFSLTMRFDPVPIAQPPFNIAISAKGLVIAIEPGGNVYQFDAKANAFVLNAALNPPLAFFRLALEADGTLWGVENATNTLRRREKNAYVTFPGLTSNTSFPSPIGIGVGADGSVLATSPDNTLFRFDPQARRFVKTEFQFPGSDNQLSVDPKGRPWVIDAVNDIYEFTGEGFEKRPGKALDVWAGANGSVFICDNTNRLKRWNPAVRNWDVVAGIQCTNVAVAPDGRPWVVTPGGQVLRAR